MAEALVDAEACSTTMDVNLAPPEEMTIQDQDNEKLVVIECDNDHILTKSGILCFLQVVSSVVGLMCVVSSGRAEDGWGGYLLLPMAGHLRVYVFAMVCTLLTSCLRLVVSCSGLIHALPLQWHLFDTVTYGVLSVLCSVGALLVSFVLETPHLDPALTHWTYEELTVSVVFGFADAILCAASAVLAWVRHRGGTSQFLARRFSSSASQRSHGNSSDPSATAPTSC